MLNNNLLGSKTKSLLISSLVAFNVPLSFGQYSFEYDDSIGVNVGIDTLTNAWGGGLNYAQFSDFDYDFDGDMDLFVFDRSSDNIRVFTQEDNGGKHYELAYNAKANFPSDLRYRTTLVDYDNDGKKDIFTYGIGGIKVFRNIGDIANGLQWELYQDLVYSQYEATYTNLYVSSSDIPAIIDVDNDGDIDILTFSLGGNHVEYHQNQSMELYGIPDSLIFELRNKCWGKFGEDVATNAIILNDPSSPCTTGNVVNPESLPNTNKSEEKHAGSSLLALDYDNSGVLDLIIGDVSYTNLNLLINGGATVNSDSPMISVDYFFPSNTTSADITLFPAAFYVDGDFDGIKDLIVCPNAKNVSFNETSVWFYKNFGSDAMPNFIFISENFLQDQMMEHGTGSVPVYFDYDEDGLEDLFVANFYRYKPTLDKESTIAYYKNTGTLTNPHFTFVDYDVFNLASENYGLRTIPTFGDIDDDGDEDMFFGVEDGSLVYFENLSVGAGAMFGPPFPNYTDFQGIPISTGNIVHPQLFDLNSDGLLDLILGKKTGELIYYKNIGNANSPLFELHNNLLGNVDLSSATPDGYAAPHFFLDSGLIQLFVGNIDGLISYFDDIENNLDPGQSFNLITSNLAGIDVDGYSAIWVNDIDNDGFWNLTVGQDLGGLYHFEADPNSNVSLPFNDLDETILIYPNPANHEITIEFGDLNATSLELYDLQGNLVIEKGINHNVETIGLDKLSKGIYLLTIQLADGRSLRKKVLKQ